MDTERSAIIVVGGEEYTLMLTTKATKEIGKKYGGLFGCCGAAGGCAAALLCAFAAAPSAVRLAL